MKIVFIGAERVGLAVLERILKDGFDISLVVTAEDSLKEKIADFKSFDKLIELNSLPCAKVKNSKGDFIFNKIQEYKPDLIIVISWSQIIPQRIIELPKLGCVGLHYSLLPKRRGGAPLNWALIDGLEKSGITLFYMDKGIDTGDIIAQKSFKIHYTDTVLDLLNKILILAPKLISKNLRKLKFGIAPRIAQNEREATYTSTRKPADSEIEPNLSFEQLYNFIRAHSPPYPCAFTKIGDKKLKFINANFESGELIIKGIIE